jgi:mannose-1-phosphate guanylyltransferase
MKAVVLAGGYATRLRPITYTIPKLLFPILGKPMIYWTLDLLKSRGVDDVVLAVNYLAGALQARVGKEYRGMRIRYSLEDQPLGTAGPIKLASHVIKLDDTFIAMNGDVISVIDLTEMLKHHQMTHASVTDALHEVDDPTRFGVVQLDSDWLINRFVEKPSLAEAPSRMINAGIYLIEPSVLRMIPSKRMVSLEREIFPVLARRRKLAGFPFGGHWFDVGSFSDYRKANFALLQTLGSKSLLGAEKSKVVPPFFLGGNTKVDKTARIGPNAVIGKNCSIGRKARVSNSILFDHISLGDESTVSGAVIASDVSIGKRVKIEPGTIISPHVQIRDGVKIQKNVVVHPYKEITANLGTGLHIM